MPSKAGPTKSQAQKRAEREEKIAEKAEARAKECAEKKAKFQQQFDEEEKKDAPKERKPWELSDDDDCQSSSESEEEERQQQDVVKPKERGRRPKQIREMANTKRQQCIVSQESSSPTTTTTILVAQPVTSGSGRLVMNHNTHCDGLIPVLRRLCHKLDPRFTITPGVICQNQSSRQGGLVIDVRRSDEDTNLNLLAKNGCTVQEIVIQKPADYDADKLYELVQSCLTYVREACAEDDRGPAGLIPALSNRELAETARVQEMNERKSQHQQAHLNAQQRDRERKEAVAEHERSKRLQGKVGREAAADYAGRDEAIVNGDARGKHAM